MNIAINPRIRRLHKLLLVAFVFLTFVQVIFGHQHHSTSLDSWNKWLTIAGFVFSLPRAFPALVESPFYGLLSFLLRVRSWIPVMLCMLLVASLGLDLFLPNNQEISRTGPTSASIPGLIPRSGETPVPGTGGQSSSSSGSASQTPVPTLSSGTPVLNDPMVSPVSTDPWDVVNQINVKCNFINGVYDMKVLPQQVDACKTEGANTNLTNFIYQITMTIVQGSGAAGIVFRDESPNSPTTNITDPDQKLSPTDTLVFDQLGGYILAVVIDGNAIAIKQGRCNSFHQGPGKPNQINVQARGQEIDVFVNGTYLISIQDNQLDSGRMGVLLAADETMGEATYSNLAIWKLD